MHKSSYQHMADLVERYLGDKSGDSLRIIDVGSSQVDEANSCYKPLFGKPGWTYVGVDIAAGLNVDLVLPSPYEFPLANDYADVVISGQAFEHIEFFWLSWLEMVRVLKPGGYIMLIAPSRGVEHRYPNDCWRFYPDGFRALGKYGNLELVEVHTDGLIGDDVLPAGSFFGKLLNVARYLVRFDCQVMKNFWGDTVGVFRKPL